MVITCGILSTDDTFKPSASLLLQYGTHCLIAIILAELFSTFRRNFKTKLSGAAAEGAAADRKTAKYAPLTQAYSFMAIAAETMGAINRDGIECLDDLGRRITQVTDDNREKAFLYQRLYVMIQRYSAVAILDTFAHSFP